jgi:hypothetical protein
VASALTVELVESCEFPLRGLTFQLIEATGGHCLPRHVSSTAPEANTESEDLMLLPWHSGSGLHFLLGRRGKEA